MAEAERVKLEGGESRGGLSVGCGKGGSVRKSVRVAKPESPWAAHVLTLLDEGHLEASRCFELP